MKKVYYDREKDKYIIQRLSLTQIDKVWWPMISDIMLRKQYEYNLSDDILERDLTTFIDNVKEVRANETGTSDGLFYPADRKIEIKKELLDKDKWDPERFYESLTHECMHAINYEKRGEFKQDRTFFAGIFGNKDGAMEIFTESEADALVYNVKNKTNDNYVIQRNTVGYGDITPYIDLISATFGVKRKELLSASIKGKSELDMLLNEHINLPRSNGENEIFKGIELNICILHNILYSEREKNEEDRKLDNENIKMANESIFKTAEKGIYNRLCNIKTDNLTEFKKQFERIKLERKIIKDIIINGDINRYRGIFANENMTELEELTCVDEGFNNIRLSYIQEILQNKSIRNKEELIQIIQNTDDIFSVKKHMEHQGISTFEEHAIPIEKETVIEYNKEYASNGMEWDNKDAVKYLKKNRKQIQGNRHTKFQILQQRMKHFFYRNSIKLLPETTKTTEREEKFWELSNWGIDKEEFVTQNEKKVVEYSKREEERTGNEISNEYEREEIE